MAVYETPLENVISRANKDSINLYAECMCKRIGAAVNGQSGSWENGTAALTDFLRNSVGVSETEFTIDDGCGLSRKNGISANVFCKVLAHDWYGPNRDAFVASLAVGGVDGKTLKKPLHRRSPRPGLRQDRLHQRCQHFERISQGAGMAKCLLFPC